MKKRRRVSLEKPAREFALCAIHILPNCSQDIRKVLKEEWYLLNERCEIDRQKKELVLTAENRLEGFFGAGISISAMVGMNGSGKSSLLELIYRVVNNLGCLLIRGKRRRAAEQMYYVDGLWVELYYVVDGRLACIACHGDVVKFGFRDEEPVTLHAFDGIAASSETVNMEDFIRWAKASLFYTIVTNYSMQAFCSQDYADEPCFILDKKRSRQAVEECVWIDGLFHKNDGYMSPIVLNPYRDEGTIDMAKEHRLTKYRLSAAMLYAQQRKWDFMKDYGLAQIVYRFDKNELDKKYLEKAKVSEQTYWNYRPGKNPRIDYGTAILCAYGAEKLDFDDTVGRATAMYLIYKTYSIANKYPSYDEFAKIGDVKRFTDDTNSETEDLVRRLVETIKKDRSHITLKIRQALHFKDALMAKKVDTQQLLIGEFNHEDYLGMVSPREKPTNMSRIQEYLPPSFFNIDILMNHYDEYGERTNNGFISINRLSSGERQYLYTFSTYIYHILNLLSIQESHRVKYRRFNLVFDEVEICFHPEFQRRFIDELLGYLRRMRMNTHATFNIIIATHSPFILSDIPQSNILYLEDGKMASHERFKNPFAANISDILYESFFLKNGFIGEWARIQINGILKSKVSWKELTEDERNVVEQIGDEYLKKQVKRHLDWKEDETDSHNA